jgi:sialate O-acetylesterase
MMVFAKVLLFACPLLSVAALEFPEWTANPPPIPTGIGFNSSFGDSMVLQQSPAKACVYGTLGAGGTAASVKVVGAGASYDVAATVTKGATPEFSLWKACLKPATVTKGITLTATCTGCTNTTAATLSDVAFGEVWYCGGQSNMALPLMHTFSRNISRDAILGGKYANLRIHGISGNMNPDQPWSTLKDMISTNADSDNSAFGRFSSTCYYFGEALSDELASQSTDGIAPPIGLVHTSFGGSTIEQWLTNKTIATCANASIDKSNQQWHDQRVMPYVSIYRTVLHHTLRTHYAHCTHT